MKKCHISTIFSAFALCCAFSVPTLVQSSDKPTCLYVASYHVGYAWSDGIERALKQRLEDQCDITAFYMDTKRKKTTANKIAAGQTAYELIKETQPAVVITSDDNAAKYLIVPHLVDTDIPVVFSGINWTVDEYGFPASNITGIVEVAPIKPMLMEGLVASEWPTEHTARTAYLGASTLSEIKNYSRVKSIADKLDISVDRILADNFSDWKKGYLLAQNYDMVIMGSNSGIAQFDTDAAAEWVLKNTKKLSMTNHEWMMPFSAIGYTKVPEEHGDWAADSTIAIINGVRAVDIPLVTNRRWDTWINEPLLDAADVNLNQSTLINAKRHK